MARYIDADKMVAKDNAYTTFPHDLAGCDDTDLVRWINEQPTADVVPKSEVEKLQEAYNDRLAKDIQTNAEFVKHAKAEAAREIFEEIDSMIFGTIIPDDCAIISIAMLAELKKKYTEEKT